MKATYGIRIFVKKSIIQVEHELINDFSLQKQAISWTLSFYEYSLKFLIFYILTFL